jgi:hypothetical protein
MSRRNLIGVIGVIAAIVTIVLAILRPATFFPVYLFAVLAWLNPALGCLLLSFIHQMTGGKWGRTLQPMLSAGAATIPWALLFAMPLFFGMHDLFPWAGADTNSLFARHPIYLSPAGYVIRGVIYGVVYLWLISLSRRTDKPWTGPVGMIAYVLTTYLLSVDWIVSLEPDWYSTGFPVVLMASQGVSALALSVAATVWLRPLTNEDNSDPKTWKDLGNLMLATLMFWAYLSYGEFLIIWSGNLPAQSSWYVQRNAGGWHYLLIGLVLLNLVAPVLLLLSGRMKRHFGGFAWVSSAVVFFQIVYLYWLIIPAFRTTGIAFHFIDLVAPIAIGGLYLFFYLGNARKKISRHA